MYGSSAGILRFFVERNRMRLLQCRLLHTLWLHMRKAIIVIGILVVIVLAWVSLRDRVTWKRVANAQLKVSMEYPVHSKYANDPFHGTSATTVTYDHVPSGITDWTLSKAARDKIVS